MSYLNFNHIFLNKILIFDYIDNFILTINTELFFIFQLLTLNAVEDKSENKVSGKLSITSGKFTIR